MILGGLFPVHEKSETETEVCLKSMHQSQCNCNAATNHHFIDHHSTNIDSCQFQWMDGQFLDAIASQEDTCVSRSVINVF